MSEVFKEKLLICVDWFLPGFKAGGQIQSCANLAYALKSQMDVYVLTTDRDLGDNKPYAYVKTNEWTSIEGIKVYYISAANLKYSSIKSIIESLKPHTVYLNSMFSIYLTLFPILACRSIY